MIKNKYMHSNLKTYSGQPQSYIFAFGMMPTINFIHRMSTECGIFNKSANITSTNVNVQCELFFHIEVIIRHLMYGRIVKKSLY